MDLKNDRMAVQRVKEACEKAKTELSSTNSTDINLPFITATNTGPKHINMNITRAKFESLIDDLIQKTLNPMELCIKDAGVEKNKINEVILVGGSTRIPKVQELLSK